MILPAAWDEESDPTDAIAEASNRKYWRPGLSTTVWIYDSSLVDGLFVHEVIGWIGHFILSSSDLHTQIFPT